MLLSNFGDENLEVSQLSVRFDTLVLQTKIKLRNPLIDNRWPAFEAK